ncbi:hypothetical protein EZS27_022786 [termite gut metagenome]|uniref:4-alpha-glucanotransferase n=1 Tax=termite gut metagenome TaxID=433724 RepID=A0A5J4R562_9ZZZZ
MSYLRFDKTLMNNLEESLPREILRTSKSGAYHCTTIVDCNTRKYHGLLIIPVSELDDENHVLLSSLDETIIQHGAEFNLGLHKYQGGVFSPNGHKYIREFDCERIPKTTYRVGGVILTKEKILVYQENRILIRYTLVEALSSPIKLLLRPYLAFRSVRQYTRENSNANCDYQPVENGIKTCMYSGYPELFMQLNKKNEFRSAPNWYKNLEYPKEQERGYEAHEDLYVPGYFEIDMKQGDSIVFSAGISEVGTRQLKQTFEKGISDRTPRDSFFHCLKNSAHQFHNKQDGEYYILAGYPWFKCRARDMFISLPGLTLAVDEIPEFENVMDTGQKAIRSFMKGETGKYKVYEPEHPDVLLWAIWTLQQYAKGTSREQCRTKYGALMEEIVTFILGGEHSNLLLRENGLLYTDGLGKAVTWMNSSDASGKPITPRTGYVVEINALWYNALRFVADMSRESGNTALADKLDAQAEVTGKLFIEVFYNEHGYLFDYVSDNTDWRPDWSVRPNMIFAAAFDYSPLERGQQKSVLDFVTRELLTPKGIRTLSPKSSGYNPNYVGPQIQRDYAYHQGTAWPWLMGFYLEAYLKIHKRSGVSFVDRHLRGFEMEMTSHCIGSIPELYDGNPPFKGRGAVSFAMSIAEILRILKLVSKFNNLEEEQQR